MEKSRDKHTVFTLSDQIMFTAQRAWKFLPET